GGMGMMGGGGMMGRGGMMRGMGIMGGDGATWAMNGMSMTGDGQPNMTPLFTIQRGKSCVLAVRNETAWWHPMHLHGHSFRVTSRNAIVNRPRKTARPFNVGAFLIMLEPTLRNLRNRYIHL